MNNQIQQSQKSKLVRRTINNVLLSYMEDGYKLMDRIKNNHSVTYWLTHTNGNRLTIQIDMIEKKADIYINRNYSNTYYIV